MTHKFRTTAGFVAIIAGALLIVGDFGVLLGYLRVDGTFSPVLAETTMYPVASFVGTSLYTATSIVTLVALAMAVLAVAGLHAQQAEHTGQLGLFCAATLMVGLTLSFAVAWFMAFLLPDVMIAAPKFFAQAGTLVSVGLIVADIFLIAGTLGYFVMTWDAGVYPSWTAMLLALSGFIGLTSFFVDVPVGEGAALGAALIGMGMSLPSIVGRAGHSPQPVEPEGDTEPGADTAPGADTELGGHGGPGAPSGPDV